MEKYIKKDLLKRVSFTEQVKSMYSSGLCLAYDRKLLDEVEYMVFEKGLTYDITTGLIAALKNGMFRLEKPLVNRRIHEQNASQPTIMLSDRIKNYQLHINGRKLQLHHMECILEKYGNLLSISDHKHLLSRINSTKKSIDYLQNHKWYKLFGLVFTLNPMENKKLLLANVALAFITKNNNH